MRAAALFLALVPLAAAAESSDVVRYEVVSSRKAMRQVYSTVLCLSWLAHATAKNEIAKEEKYAREGGGMVNSVKLYELQRVMRAADEKRDAARQQLGKTRPLACADRTVGYLVACSLLDAGDSSDELNKFRLSCEEVRPKVMVGLIGLREFLAGAERWASLR